MRDHRLYLKDILSAIDDIEKFAQGMDFDAFQADDKTVSAVIRKLEIIGEATKGIPMEVRALHAHIPWKEMAGMRDKLIHFYFGVDCALIWATIKKRLPEVKVWISAMESDERERGSQVSTLDGRSV